MTDPLIPAAKAPFLPIACGGTVMVLALAVLIGWAADIPELKSLRPDWVAMKANTALAFLFAGASLLLWTSRRGNTPGKASQWGAHGCATAVLLIGLLSLLEYATGKNLHLDQLLFQEAPGAIGTSHPGRMAPSTALGFLWVGIALHLPRKEPWFPAFQGLVLAAGLTSLLILVGYCYNARLFPSYTRMAAHTAALFFLLSAGLLYLRPNRGLVGLCLSSSAGGILLRNLLPPILIAPVAIGWLRLQAELAGWYGPEEGVALFAFSNLVLMGGLIWITASRLHVSDLERKRAEHQSHYLAAIVESSSDAIIGESPDGRVESWNKGAEQIFGYAKNEIIGQFVTRLFPPGHEADTASIHERLRRGESVEHFESTALAKSGKHLVISTTASPIRDASEKIIGISRVAHDITARRKNEREIKDLRAALDHHAIVAITDSRGKITYVNDKFCAISKYSREELLGQDHRIINSGHHPKEFIRDLWTTIGHGKVWHGELKNRAKDGTFYWVDTTIVPFLDEAGKPVQYVAIRADITERKRVEDKILEINTSLEQKIALRTEELTAANKELEAFCYAVSHDLRAPLRAIAGFAQAIDSQYRAKLDDTAHGYFNRILAATKRMSDLIDDLLRLSRVTRAEFDLQPVNLSAIVQQATQNLIQVHPSRTVEVSIADQVIVHGDARLLRILVENLLENAWKFTSHQQHPRIEFGSSRTPEEETVCFLRDNGAGFDMQYAGKLFNAFQRLHSMEEFPGTGIGLAIAQRIIHRHSGRIWAEARVGEGATFFFLIPNLQTTPKS